MIIVVSVLCEPTAGLGLKKVHKSNGKSLVCEEKGEKNNES
jgi:hypothetical protein